MPDNRTILDLTVEELTGIFETRAQKVATTFATTKIQEAVKTGCLDCLKEFGFDTNHPEECVKNQLYLTRSRVSAEKVTTAVKVSFATAIVTVLIGGACKILRMVVPMN